MANLRCDILQIWTVNGNLIFLLDVESSDKAKFIITSIEVAQISYIKYNKQKDMIEFDIISISLEIFIVVICFLIFGKMSWLWRKSNKMKFFFHSIQFRMNTNSKCIIMMRNNIHKHCEWYRFYHRNTSLYIWKRVPNNKYNRHLRIFEYWWD